MQIYKGFKALLETRFVINQIELSIRDMLSWIQSYSSYLVNGAELEV